MSVETYKRNFLHNAFYQMIPEGFLLLRSFFHRSHSYLNRFAKTDNSWGVLRSAAAFPLLGAAVDKCFCLNPGADIQETYSSGAI